MPISLRLPLFALAAALLAGNALAQAATPEAGASAEQVMAGVKDRAAAGHKNILISFGASWCGNCRLFDKFLADPAIHPIMDRLFVFTELNTGERLDDQRHANIPGGQKLEDALGGKGAGYPYLAITDAQGKLITDSLRPGGSGYGENIGYPDAPAEIDWFLEMLRKAAPSLSPQDTATIRNWLTEHNSAHRKSAS